MQVRVNLIIYIIALMSLVGWVLFSVFGGVGMIALPLDWINAFIHRPVPITKETYTQNKIMLGEQSALLMEVGVQVQEDLKGAPRKQGLRVVGKNLRKKEKEFKRDVMILEYHYRHLEDAFKNGGGNVLIHYGKLGGGILS